MQMAFCFKGKSRTHVWIKELLTTFKLIINYFPRYRENKLLIIKFVINCKYVN